MAALKLMLTHLFLHLQPMQLLPDLYQLHCLVLQGFFVQLQTFGTKSENYLPSILLRGHP